MKIKSKALFCLLAGIILVYDGCKKSSTTPVVTNTVAPQTVASQLAVNISESLTGGFGGFEVLNSLDPTTVFSLHSVGGVDIPSTLSLHRSQSIFTTRSRMKQILRALNPICGTVSDTTINETDSSNGLTVSASGEIKFTFSCTNGVLSGFTNIDNLSIKIGSADTSITYKIAENVSVSAVSPGVSGTSIKLNGTVGSTLSIIAGPKSAGSESFNYTFNSVVISPTDGIESGSASFSTTASTPQGSWNYSGTITFLGNGEANITISGVTFKVNLDTGVVG